MSLSAVTNNICKKLDSSLSGFVNTARAAYTAVSNGLNTIKTTISGMQFSLINDLQLASAQVDAGLNDAIPDFTDEFTDVLNMINSCAFLKTDKTLGNPLTMIRSLKGSMRLDSQNIFDSLTSGLAEFNVSKLMDSVFVRYDEEFKFGDIVPNIYKIIDCVDSLCPNTDITSKILAFEEYVNKLYLLTNGKFDKVTFFNELGLSAGNIANIDIGLNSYENMRDRITDSISNGVDFAKSLL